MLNPKETINSDVYYEQLDRSNQNLIRKLWIEEKLFFNARLQAARKTREKIFELGREVLPHPPYSPDIALFDHHLFRLLKFLRNKTLEDVN